MSIEEKVRELIKMKYGTIYRMHKEVGMFQHEISKYVKSPNKFLVAKLETNIKWANWLDVDMVAWLKVIEVIK